VNASRMMFAMQGFDRYLRTHAKHSDEPPGIDEIREEFHALLLEWGIDINE
jgi:hypothetical protein